MVSEAPYLYGAESIHSSDLPSKPFDPKAVTRASYQPKPKKKRHNGPLISFNRHPDAHMPIPYRTSNYEPMSRGTKQWVVRIRWVQLGLRVLELIGATGLLVLLILISKIDSLSSWIMRITAGVVMIHTFYGAYHHHRPAGARAPSSSAAYQVFAGVSDICVLPMYAYGAIVTHQRSGDWSTLISNKEMMVYFVPAVYYTYIGAGGLHFLSLCISTWLALMFRKITLMPPDMNPLEDNLTARPRHKKNMSSVSTMDLGKNNRRSGVSCEDVSRPRSVPFLHTRAESIGSSTLHDSRLDLPSRHYQIIPGNSSKNSPRESPRNSPRDSRGSATPSDWKRMSAPPGRFSAHGSYTEVSKTASEVTGSPGKWDSRDAKFTETWSTSESLISRTQNRNRAMQAAMDADERRHKAKSYEALSQRYSFPESDDENDLAGSDFDDDDTLNSSRHPNPLRSNPTSPRPKTPHSGFGSSGVLSDLSPNGRSVSGNKNVADQWSSNLDAKTTTTGPWKQNRDSSIQHDEAFYSKPYGLLKPGTPPIMIGTNRQTSSGNDYEKRAVAAFGRRNVSGVVAEEGRAGNYRRSALLD